MEIELGQVAAGGNSGGNSKRADEGREGKLSEEEAHKNNSSGEAGDAAGVATGPGTVGGFHGTYNICFMAWMTLLALVSAIFFLVAIIDAALVTPPEVADQVVAAVVAVALCVTCVLVLLVAMPAQHSDKSGKRDSNTADNQNASAHQPQQYEQQVAFDAGVTDSARCSASPGCFACCAVLGLPLVLVLAVLTLYNSVAEVSSLLTLPPPGELVVAYDADGVAYPTAHIICDDNSNGSSLAGSFLPMHQHR